MEHRGKAVQVLLKGFKQGARCLFISKSGDEILRENLQVQGNGIMINLDPRIAGYKGGEATVEIMRASETLKLNYFWGSEFANNQVMEPNILCIHQQLFD